MAPSCSGYSRVGSWFLDPIGVSPSDVVEHEKVDSTGRRMSTRRANERVVVLRLTRSRSALNKSQRATLGRHVAVRQPRASCRCGGPIRHRLLRGGDSSANLRACFHAQQLSFGYVTNVEIAALVARRMRARPAGPANPHASNKLDPRRMPSAEQPSTGIVAEREDFGMGDRRRDVILRRLWIRQSAWLNVSSLRTLLSFDAQRLARNGRAPRAERARSRKSAGSLEMDRSSQRIGVSRWHVPYGLIAQPVRLA